MDMRVAPTILLVEDDESDIVLIRAALEQAGIAHSLQVVRDGEEAIRYLSDDGSYSDRKQYPLPMLILLDLAMPKKTGFEVLQWMGERPEPVPYSVVVVSASDASEDLVRAYDLGARSFLVKPETFHELVELVVPLQRYLHRPTEAIPLRTPNFERRKPPTSPGSRRTGPG
jgi:CheY-like chemotaxis protein